MDTADQLPETLADRSDWELLRMPTSDVMNATFYLGRSVGIEASMYIRRHGDRGSYWLRVDPAFRHQLRALRDSIRAAQALFELGGL